MHVHKGGQIKNWGGECRDVTPTKLQCQIIQIERRNGIFVKFNLKYRGGRGRVGSGGSQGGLNIEFKFL